MWSHLAAEDAGKCSFAGKPRAQLKFRYCRRSQGGGWILVGIWWLTPYLLNQIVKKGLSDRKTHQSKWTKLRAYRLIFLCLYLFPRAAFCPGGSDNKASAYNAGDPGSIPESGRSPGEGNGNPLQYSCLENPMDGGVWWATVHGVANSWTRLSDFTLLYFRAVLQSTTNSVA